jgi:putative ABC transport system permease protein
MNTLWQDLRYGFRMLWKSPGFTFVALLTIALGIGANTAIFSVVNATLLLPLPYQDPNQIVLVWGTNPHGFGWHGKTGFSVANFLDYKEQNKVFEEMSAFLGTSGFTLTGTDHAEHIKGGSVTSDFFKVLKVQPILGRSLSPEDEQPGRDHVVLLSHGLWQRRFGSDQKIVGETIQLDAKPYTVVGVLPPGFEFSIPDFYSAKDLWVPAIVPNDKSDRAGKYLIVLARLKPGVTRQMAQADLDAITGRLTTEYSREMSGFGTRLVPLQEQIFGDVRLVLLILFGAVGFVLLISCANVASLQLARASTRQKEIAIRAALGASRGRLARQLLTESMLLAVIGGALGVLIGSWGIKLLTGLRPASLLPGLNITIDFTVLGYSLVLSVITGILFGFVPALQSKPRRLSESLKEGGKTSAAGDSGRRIRGLLAISEIALSLVLLIGAGLLIRSFVGLLMVDPGFETKNILTVPIHLPEYAYQEPTKQAEFYTQVMERIKALPGVTAVGATSDLPPTGNSHSSSFSIDGHALPVSDNSLGVEDRLATPEYFRVMGIPVAAGRPFSEADNRSAPPVALVNQTFARRFFPNENPVGQRLRFDEPKPSNPWITIVGVVGDVRGFGLDKEPNSEIYLAYQQPNVWHYNPLPNLHLVVRTAGEPNSVAPSVLATVQEFDKDVPLPHARTMETILAASIGARRFNMVLLGLFAGIATILAAVGIYGMISFSVAQRTREIGIRMALGARRADVLKLVLRNGMILALSGVVIGLAGAFALTRLMATLLFAVTPTDAVTYTIVSIGFLAVALFACLIPARRAMKVDPLVALRYE